MSTLEDKQDTEGGTTCWLISTCCVWVQWWGLSYERVEKVMARTPPAFVNLWWCHSDIFIFYKLWSFLFIYVLLSNVLDKCTAHHILCNINIMFSLLSNRRPSSRNHKANSMPTQCYSVMSTVFPRCLLKCSKCKHTFVPSVTSLPKPLNSNPNLSRQKWCFLFQCVLTLII